MWSCNQCTFENPDSAKVCGICNYGKGVAAPVYAPAPVAVRRAGRQIEAEPYYGLVARYGSSKSSAPPPASSSAPVSASSAVTTRSEAKASRPWQRVQASRRWHHPDVDPIVITDDDIIVEPPITGDEFWPIPLESVQVNVIIHDFSAQVTIEQAYYNSEEDAIEVKYLFPLDDSSAVAKFEATFGDRPTIRGVINEKHEAKRRYQAAVASGHQAALMEQDLQKPNVFTCTIGNLRARERCVIKFTYVTEVKIDQARARFYLPTVVAPVYVPTADLKLTQVRKPTIPTLSEAIMASSPMTVENVDDASKHGDRAVPLPDSVLVPRVPGESLPYRLSFNIDVTQPSAITTLTSPSHGVIVSKKSDTRSVVTLADGSMTMDRDFVLLITQASPYGSRAIVERFADAGKDAAPPGSSLALQITFCEQTMDMKDVMEDDLFCELIFLVDMSGSMAGSPMDHTRAMLQIFLRSLPEKCYFNIIGFDDRIEQLFRSGSQPYNDDTLSQATRFVSGLKARGGTEILPPLRQVFAQPPREGYPRQVFVLTDGEISNTNQVIALVRENADNARVFTFGIGRSVDHSLVNGMARAGRGVAEFVTDNDQISTKVAAHLKRALQPAITGVSVDWGEARVTTATETKEGSSPAPVATPITPGGPMMASVVKDATSAAITAVNVRQSPVKLPTIYPGTRYFVYGLIDDTTRVTKLTKFDVNVTVSFTNGHKKVVIIPINGSDGRSTRDGSLIHKLAARARIKELETAGDNDGMTKGEILYLSLRYGIISAHTSFVAIADEPLTDLIDKEAKKRDVAIAGSHGSRITAPSPAEEYIPIRTHDQQRRYLESQRAALQQQQQQLLLQPDSVSAEEIELRHREILTIERDLTEVNEMFRDLSRMVSSQSEQLDVINSSVAGSKAYIARGETQLHQAEQQRRSGVTGFFRGLFGSSPPAASAARSQALADDGLLGDMVIPTASNGRGGGGGGGNGGPFAFGAASPSPAPPSAPGSGSVRAPPPPAPAPAPLQRRGTGSRSRHSHSNSDPAEAEFAAPAASAKDHDEALAELSASVDRIKELSRDIGAELHTSHAMLDDLDDHSSLSHAGLVDNSDSDDRKASAAANEKSKQKKGGASPSASGPGFFSRLFSSNKKDSAAPAPAPAPGAASPSRARTSFGATTTTTTTPSSSFSASSSSSSSASSIAPMSEEEKIMAHGMRVLEESRASLHRSMANVESAAAIGSASNSSRLAPMSLSMPAPAPIVAPAEGKISGGGAPVAIKKNVANDYRQLIECQRSDGSWALDVLVPAGKTIEGIRGEFEAALTRYLSAIGSDDGVRGFTISREVMDQEYMAVIGTCFALAILAAKYNAKSAEWSILAQKARSSLGKRFNKLVIATGGAEPPVWSKSIDSFITMISSLAA